jgi:hypothetical protein
LVTDVGHFEEELVEPGGLGAAAESDLMHSGGASGNYHAIELLLLDQASDFFLARVSTGVPVDLRDDDVIEFGSLLGELVAIDDAGNVAAAFADEDTDAGLGRFGWIGLVTLGDGNHIRLWVFSPIWLFCFCTLLQRSFYPCENAR